MSLFYRGISAILVLVGIATITAPLVYAANDTPKESVSSGNGYRVSPVRTPDGLQIPPGGTKTIRVYITNLSGHPEDLKVLINDFRSDSEEGAPALYLTGASAPRHSLKQYATPLQKTMTLQPNEQKPVDVKISIPATATPGGYFGAVRFAPANTSGKDTVNLAASVASLVLVTVPGNYKEQVSIASFGAVQDGQRHSFFTSPKKLQAVVRFQNSGDVQEQPFGKILLRKGSTVLGSYEINNTSPRGNVLPDSIRRFSVDLSKIGSFGKYTLEGNFGYGNKGQLLSSKANFYVVPLALIIAVIVGIIVLLFLIFGLPRLMRNYKRKVIRESRGKG